MKMQPNRLRSIAFWSASTLILLTHASAQAQSAAESMFDRATAHKSAKVYPAAIAAYDSAATAAAATQSWEIWAEARIKSAACRAYDGQLVDAIDHFLVTRRDLPGKMADSLTWGYAIRVDRSLAFNYTELGVGDRYLYYQQEVLQTMEKAGSPAAKRAQIYLGIGSQFIKKGDMKQAVTYLKAGLALVAERPMLASKFWTTLGLAAQHSGDYAGGESAFLQALSLRQNVRPRPLEGIARAHLYLASVHLDMHASEKASSDLREAAKMLTYCPDCPVLWGDYASQMATLRELEGDLPGAIAEGEKALAHFAGDNPYGRETAQQWVENGNLRCALNQPDSAIADYQSALRVLLPDFRTRPAANLPKLDSLRTDPWIFLALQGLADAASQRFGAGQAETDLRLSVAAMGLAVDQASLVRRAFASEEARLNLSGKIYSLYEKAIVRATTLAQVSGDAAFDKLAFSFAEQGKAAVLLEEIGQANALGKIGLPDSLQNRLQELDLNYRYFRQCAQEGSDERATECARRQDETLLERDQLMLTLRKEYPAYHQVRYQAAPISIDSVQARLRPQEAMVEYFFGDSHLVTFVIAPDTFFTYSTALPKDLAGHIRRLRGTLSAVGGSEQLKIFRSEARTLYLQVVDGWMASLPEGTESLTIVPDGLLNYVPFEVLLGEEPGEKIYPQLPYLIRKYRFSYGYSASLRYREVPQELVGNREILACALSFSEDAGDVERGSKGREQLSALPNVRAEAEAIRESFEGLYLLDEAATETAFREYAPKYGMLHLATHTVFNDSNPDATRIVFAAEDGEMDGYLHAFELYGLRLDADLAVLSACQTGDGELLRGEGVMSLGRAFTYAGCRSTVMTLWPLNDRSSGEIMATFYRYLADGKARDEALHQAKIDFLDAQDGPRANPFYWAAFIHSGQSGPVVAAKTPRLFWWVSAGSAPVLLLLLLLFLRRRARSAPVRVRS